MPSPYAAPRDLARLADRFGQTTPSLLILTDPERTPDPLALARRSPVGSGLIYRHFGRPDRYEIAAELARICAGRGMIFMVSADWDLARRSGAGGMHWPQARLSEVSRTRCAVTGMILTASAHSEGEIRRAAQLGLDAVLYSPVFPSHSPSAIWPKGAMRTRSAIRRADLPVYCLGGMDAETIKRLAGAGAAGFAMIGAMNMPTQIVAKPAG